MITALILSFPESFPPRFSTTFVSSHSHSFSPSTYPILDVLLTFPAVCTTRLHTTLSASDSFFSAPSPERNWTETPFLDCASLAAEPRNRYRPSLHRAQATFRYRVDGQDDRRRLNEPLRIARQKGRLPSEQHSLTRPFGITHDNQRQVTIRLRL